MIVTNTKKKVFSSFSPAYISKVCKLLTPHDFMIDKWIGDLDLDVLDYAKKMMLSRKEFLHRASVEYGTAHPILSHSPDAKSDFWPGKKDFL